MLMNPVSQSEGCSWIRGKMNKWIKSLIISANSWAAGQTHDVRPEQLWDTTRNFHYFSINLTKKVCFYVQNMKNTWKLDLIHVQKPQGCRSAPVWWGGLAAELLSCTHLMFYRNFTSRRHFRGVYALKSDKEVSKPWRKYVQQLIS